MTQEEMLEDIAREQMQELRGQMREMGQKARQAQHLLATASSKLKERAIMAMADRLEGASEEILAANQRDISAAKGKAMSAALIDRLTLDTTRLCAISTALRQIACLPDPVGHVISAWERPNGLHIERVRTPLGVVGVIYESRPNVTADAAALCLKAGNAVILRGGSDSFHSSSALHRLMLRGLVDAGLPEASVQMVHTQDRRAVGELLTGLDGAIDVIVPRGGKSLVARIQQEAKVPIFAHLEGLCHAYLDRTAQLDMARSVIVNAKMRRTGICGALETLLVDRAIAQTHLVPVLTDLANLGCEIRGCDEVVAHFPAAKAAEPQDWATEYLDAILSVKIVDGINEAIDHINRYSSHHTETIIAEDKAAVEAFFAHIDSAILLHNASTQFADGGEFGFGGEIGIATGKLHARGPIGVEQLTSFKYRIHGRGQIRP